MTGTLYTIGVGPGDPELLTLKAARILRTVPVIAFFAKRGRAGHARGIVEGHLAPSVTELRFDYPFTTEIGLQDPAYRDGIGRFYDQSAAALACTLDEGRDVALLCEGDPFFYGSSMYLFDRLRAAYHVEIVPGITGMSGCWAAAALPITHGNDVLTVLPGTLDAGELARRLTGADAAVIMKVGRNLAKIRAALEAAGLMERAVYVERGGMTEERVLKLRDLDGVAAPYFSMILVPGRQRER